MDLFYDQPNCHFFDSQIRMFYIHNHFTSKDGGYCVLQTENIYDDDSCLFRLWPHSSDNDFKHVDCSNKWETGKMMITWGWHSVFCLVFFHSTMWGNFCDDGREFEKTEHLNIFPGSLSMSTVLRWFDTLLLLTTIFLPDFWAISGVKSQFEDRWL